MDELNANYKTFITAWIKFTLRDMVIDYIPGEPPPAWVTDMIRNCELIPMVRAVSTLARTPIDKVIPAIWNTAKIVKDKKLAEEQINPLNHDAA